ncbi:MAG: hypothetical protein ACXWSD_07635, partial [Bdellovibrionota bacterium]
MKLFSVIFVLGSLSSSAFARDLILGGQEVKAADPIQASTVGVYSPSADGQSGALCTGTLIKK